MRLVGHQPRHSSHHKHLTSSLSPMSPSTDLDQELMLSSLGEYCRTVGRAPVTLDTLPALLRELGLVRDGTAGDTPTIGCCLLFASDLPDDFRHAAVAITRSGKGRTIVTGNLIRQRRELIDLLDGPDLNPRLKVKGKRAYEERTAYASRAIIELVINLLVHRDYERQELAEIDVIAGQSMRFTNPGIIANELRERLQIDEQGRFRPIRTLSHIRNPVDCRRIFRHAIDGTRRHGPCGR